MAAYKKILVVEDNAINRNMLRNILSGTYVVLEAADGRQALEVLASQTNIALILLDIRMPGMDGYTFLSITREDPILSAIPVIVTTQSDSEEDEVRALAQGATDFVSKPYRPQVILHRIASILRLRESAAMLNTLQFDRLTGLYTKDFFFREAKERLEMYPDREFDIICSDVENFKLVNDVLGVPAGDRLLQEAAAICQRQVSGRGICGRFNADRFAILTERLEAYTEETFEQINRQLNLQHLVRPVVLKWGVYHINNRQLPISHMCDRALLAIEGIKGQYGKNFAVYDDNLRRQLLRQQAITDSMESALAGGEFTVYLQPKYRLENDTLSGAEALVRWEHPQWGLLSPGEFIPLFERNGFITRLDQYVWEQTCALLRAWQDRGLTVVPLSVNVSRADIYQADLPGYLLALVRKYDLPPRLLHLEITESAFTEDTEQVVSAVEQLRGLGFVIEMDDFGSGYSSLNMLSRMQLDILKLDMRFIQGQTSALINQGMLRFVMNLAQWMDLQVTAEGVELQEQADRLREIGCHYVQGYLYARPMPSREFALLLAPHGADAPSRRVAGV